MMVKKVFHGAVIAGIGIQLAVTQFYIFRHPGKACFGQAPAYFLKKYGAQGNGIPAEYNQSGMHQADEVGQGKGKFPGEIPDDLDGGSIPIQGGPSQVFITDSIHGKQGGGSTLCLKPPFERGFTENNLQAAPAAAGTGRAFMGNAEMSELGIRRTGLSEKLILYEQGCAYPAAEPDKGVIFFPDAGIYFFRIGTAGRVIEDRHRIIRKKRAQTGDDSRFPLIARKGKGGGEYLFLFRIDHGRKNKAQSQKLLGPDLFQYLIHEKGTADLGVGIGRSFVQPHLHGGGAADIDEKSMDGAFLPAEYRHEIIPGAKLQTGWLPAGA